MLVVRNTLNSWNLKHLIRFAIKLIYIPHSWIHTNFIQFNNAEKIHYWWKWESKFFNSCIQHHSENCRRNEDWNRLNFLISYLIAWIQTKMLNQRFISIESLFHSLWGLNARCKLSYRVNVFWSHPVKAVKLWTIRASEPCCELWWRHVLP